MRESEDEVWIREEEEEEAEMFKAKLQELSQQKRWGLPRYTAMKGGPDHLPHFKASVYVNGLSFHSPIVSTSSKQALNEAAKLAFLHFSSSSASYSQASETGAEGKDTKEAVRSSDSHSVGLVATNCSPRPRAEQDVRGSGTVVTHSHALIVKDDFQYPYKSQLQNYARSKNLDPPLYSNKRDGLPHALRFKATVTVNENAFESPGFFSKLKNAEHAAAKVALMSLLPHDFQEDESSFYKNALRELAQKELLCIPTYETTKCGPSHKPLFFSTVEVDAETFSGKAGHSKKQAEAEAAKVAYTAFKDRQRPQFPSPDSPASKALIVDSQQALNSQLPLLLAPTTDHEEDAEIMKDEVQEAVSAEALSATEISLLMKQKEGSVSKMEPLELSASSAEITGKKSYLLCGRVRVYPCFPDVIFPKGITVLPIAEDKWVPVSLEFMDEKGN